MKIKALQGVTNKFDAWTLEKVLIFFPNKTIKTIFRKRNEEPKEISLKEPNYTLHRKYLVLGDGPRQLIKLGGIYIDRVRAKAKGAINTMKMGRRQKNSYSPHDY